MKNIRQIVLSREEVEEMVKSCIQSYIPKNAKVYVCTDGDWFDFPSYQKEKDCIKIEFDQEDIEKEINEKITKESSDGKEMPWTFDEAEERGFNG